MNRIFKVIYSKTKHCYVVVSELAKNRRKCHSVTVKGKTALAAAVLLAVTSFTFTGMPVAQAAESIFSNDYVGTNYKNDSGKSYSESETKNYKGGGAEGVGSNTWGLNAQAGRYTTVIGDRNASLSQYSIYIGSKYDANNQVFPDSGHYVVSIGFDSDAAGTGSVALGNGALADTFDTAGSGKNPDAEHHSIAIGQNARAKNNNIAIGANSVATDAKSSTDAAFTGQLASAADSYISVGGKTTDSSGN